MVIHNREKGGGKGVFLVIKNALFLANIKKTQKISRLRRAFASGGACGGLSPKPLFAVPLDTLPVDSADPGSPKRMS